MITDSFYIETSFPVENYTDLLLDEYESKKIDAKVYQFVNIWPSHNRYHIISEDIPVAQLVADKFKEMYDIVCFPRYYILDKGFVLDIHKDSGTQASFNYLLSDNNDPLEFYQNGNKTDLSYKKGLLNLQVTHAVPKSNNIRILLKLSIYNYSFEECKKKIIEYENSNIR